MSRKPNQFAEQAQIAHAYVLPKDHQRVEHKDNIIIYNFLLCVLAGMAYSAAGRMRASSSSTYFKHCYLLQGSRREVRSGGKA